MKGQTLSRHFNGEVLCHRGMHCSIETLNKAAVQSSEICSEQMLYDFLALQQTNQTIDQIPHVLSQYEVTSFWAELVSKTMNASLITLNVYKTSDSPSWYHLCDSRLSPRRSITVSRPSFKWKSTYAPAQKVCLLPSGCSLFNQSNVKPGDLISLEIHILWGSWEATEWLSRALLKIETVSGSLCQPPFLLKGFFRDFWGILS